MAHHFYNVDSNPYHNRLLNDGFSLSNCYNVIGVPVCVLPVKHAGVSNNSKHTLSTNKPLEVVQSSLLSCVIHSILMPSVH